MFDRETRLFLHMLDYAGQLVEDVDDDDFAAQPVTGLNHPAHVLGHLAAGNYYILSLLGVPAGRGPEWLEVCYPGKVPSPRRADYPDKAEIVAAFDASNAALLAALPGLTAEQCARPHAIDYIREHLPNLGDAVAYLITTHLAVHLGQLSAWRRTMAMAPAHGGKAAGPEEVGMG